MLACPPVNVAVSLDEQGVSDKGTALSPRRNTSHTRSVESFGRYRFVRRLGGGDTSEVLLCDHGSRRVAMKVFSIQGRPLQEMIAEAADDLEARLRRRFVAEAELVAGLEHPNIVEILEITELLDDRPCFVMPFLPGSLRDKIFGDLATDGARLMSPPAPRALALERVQEILPQVLAGMAEVHHRGIVHRDLKPDHIRFDDHGNAVVCDFSVAKTPWSGYTPIRQGFGTRPFMSPEQEANAADVDARSDV